MQWIHKALRPSLSQHFFIPMSSNSADSLWAKENHQSDNRPTYVYIYIYIYIYPAKGSPPPSSDSSWSAINLMRIVTYTRFKGPAHAALGIPIIIPINMLSRCSHPELPDVPLVKVLPGPCSSWPLLLPFYNACFGTKAIMKRKPPLTPFMALLCAMRIGLEPTVILRHKGVPCRI
jgi:hypothetical protein